MEIFGYPIEGSLIVSGLLVRVEILIRLFPMMERSLEKPLRDDISDDC